MLKPSSESLMGMRCCCEQGAAAYRTVLCQNQYSGGPCRDAHFVTMTIWVTEYLVMACSTWYEEARDGRFWLFPDALFGWVKQLKPAELAGDDAEALGFFQAMMALRAALPVHDQSFHDAVRRFEISRRDRDGCLTVMT